MTNITWTVDANGDWSDAADWSGGHVPGAGSSVTLSSLSPVTITYDQTDKIGKLISSDDLLSMSGGSLGVAHTINLAGGLDETGGTLSIGRGLSTLAGGVTISTGDVSLSGGATIDLNGAVTFGDPESSYGAHVYGHATMVSSGTVTIVNAGDVGEATFGNRLTWINTGTVIQAGIVNAAYNGGIAFTIINQAGAVFDFTTDIACLMNMQIVNGKGSLVTASSDFTNAGLLEKTGGTGATTVYSTITSTGTIEVLTGTIDIEDGGTIGGLVGGGGILQFSDGGTLANVTVSVAQIDLSGGNLVLNNATISGLLNGYGGASIVAGASFDVTGAVGSGLTVTMGSGTDLAIADPSMFLGTINNFTVGDTLDVGLGVDTASVDGNGILSLFDSGALVGTLVLAPSNAGDIFTLASDMNGGTLLEISGGAASVPRMGFVAGGNWLGTTLATGFGGEMAQRPAPAVLPEIGRLPADGLISLSGTHWAAPALILHAGH